MSRYTLNELVGTMFLQIVSQATIVATGAIINAGPAICGSLSNGRILAVSLAEGFALAAMLFAAVPYGIYSGQTSSPSSSPRSLFGCGHFNPMITLMALLTREIRGQQVRARGLWVQWGQFWSVNGNEVEGREGREGRGEGGRYVCECAEWGAT